MTYNPNIQPGDLTMTVTDRIEINPKIMLGKPASVALG